MYGFGDAEEPLPETVNLVEELTIDYLSKFAAKAMEAANRRGRLQTEDLMYVIRHDEKKLARCQELLDMNEQLKEARKNFDTTDAGAADAGAGARHVPRRGQGAPGRAAQPVRPARLRVERESQRGGGWWGGEMPRVSLHALATVLL